VNICRPFSINISYQETIDSFGCTKKPILGSCLAPAAKSPRRNYEIFLPIVIKKPG